MRIEAPLRKASEIEYLIEAGADMFYCGVLAKEKINNRHNTVLHQFSGFAELGPAINKAHGFNKKVFLTLNSQNAGLEGCIAQAEEALKVGIDGFIAADILLIEALGYLNDNIPVYLSVLAGAFNAESVRFYLRKNVKGFCMPRNIAVQNMQAMVRNLPPMEVTAFVSGNCPYTQAFCRLHNMKTKVPIYMNEGGYGELFCEGWDKVMPEDAGGADEDESFLPRVGSMNWCALCSLPLLKKAGITNLKIEGRSLDMHHKVKKTRYIKNALDAINKLPLDEYAVYCKSLYEKEFGYSCNPTDCYYRI